MFLQKDYSGGHNLVKTGNIESLQKYAEKLDDKIYIDDIEMRTVYRKLGQMGAGV